MGDGITNMIGGGSSNIGTGSGDISGEGWEDVHTGEDPTEP